MHASREDSVCGHLVDHKVGALQSVQHAWSTERPLHLSSAPYEGSQQARDDEAAAFEVLLRALAVHPDARMPVLLRVLVLVEAFFFPCRERRVRSRVPSMS